MKATDLRLRELIEFEDGRVSIDGRRMILHDVHALAQLRKDLVEAMGAGRSRGVLARFGFYWGEADAAGIRRACAFDSPEEWLLAGPRLHAMQGVADVRVEQFDLRDGRLRMEVVWRNSAEADEQLLELGAGPDAGCWISQGYASGYATYCLDKPVFFTETSCRGRGDRVCRALGMDAESWGADAEAFAAMYPVADIRRKVDDLDSSLRQRPSAARRPGAAAGGVGAPALHGARSRSFQQVLDVARRVARFDTSVLVTGESGVGKEVVARFVHENSSRRSGPFVAINCGALPESLLESELFGHVAGAFTDARRDRTGLFEQAERGTLLLDEIGDLSPSLQVKLLRVLQERSVRRVGENAMRPIDVRVIAATNRRLQEEVRRGAFREDLLYRLRVIEIFIPPLRERSEDILPLARHFVERIVERLGLENLSLHASAIAALERYDWPGNVRELENALEGAAVLSGDGWIRAEHLPVPSHDTARETPGGGAVERPDPPPTLQEAEAEQIRAVLKSTGGNKTKAARILGISYSTLWRRLRRFESEGK